MEPLRNVLKSGAIIFLLCGFAHGQDAKSDIAKLKGIWVLDNVEWLGEKTSQQLTDLDIRLMKLRGLPEKRNLLLDLKKYRTTIHFKDNAFVRQFRIWEFGPRQKIARIEGAFQLNTAKTPKVLQMEEKSETFQYDDDFGNETGPAIASKKIRRCIYLLEGDTLRCGWQMGGDREKLPATFSTSDNRTLYVFTFIREKQ